MTVTYRVLLLPGDGVGPEVTREAAATLQQVADARGFTLEMPEALIGGSAIDTYGVPLRDEDVAAAQDADAILLGAVGGPAWDAQPRDLKPERGLLRMRASLELFANLRPIKVFDALVDSSPVKAEVVRGVDLLIVRELTGGLYFGQPSKVWNGDEGRQAVDTLEYRESEITRVIDLAFRLAAERRGLVTSVDKANVLSSSVLWRTIANEIGQQYPEQTLEHALVDSCAMQLIRTPRAFDVMVMENMFGDILSDEAAVLAGSLGMLPSASVNGRAPSRAGSSGVQVGMYEPIHGSAPDIAGKGIANPCGAILSAAMLLRTSLGLGAEASAIEQAVEDTLGAGVRTRDIATEGDAASTTEFGDEVRARLATTLAALA